MPRRRWSRNVFIRRCLVESVVGVVALFHGPIFLTPVISTTQSFRLCRLQRHRLSLSFSLFLSLSFFSSIIPLFSPHLLIFLSPYSHLRLPILLPLLFSLLFPPPPLLFLSPYSPLLLPILLPLLFALLFAPHS